MKIRKNPTRYMLRLDEMEQQAGLFSDLKGQIHVLTPMIQSELIRNKTYYNYKNQDRLIKELEQRFQCEFSKVDAVMENEKEELFFEKKFELSNLTPKEILKAIINDSNMYVRLKREYVRYGRGGKSVLLKQIKPRTAKEDLLYFIEHGVDYEIVKKVMQRHLKSNKDAPCSYLQDKGASERIERIQMASDSSMEIELYKMIEHQLKLARREKREIKFGKITEMEDFIRKLRDILIKSYGLKPQVTEFEVDHIRALLNYMVDKSSKFKTTREFTILGFKDKQTVLKKYGIERIV